MWFRRYYLVLKTQTQKKWRLPTSSLSSKSKHKKMVTTHLFVVLKTQTQKMATTYLFAVLKIQTQKNGDYPPLRRPET
jgi:hypothetical protein